MSDDLNLEKQQQHETKLDHEALEKAKEIKQDFKAYLNLHRPPLAPESSKTNQPETQGSLSIFQSILEEDVERLIIESTQSNQDIKSFRFEIDRERLELIWVTPHVKQDFLYNFKSRELTVNGDHKDMSYIQQIQERIAKIQAAVKRQQATADFIKFKGRI